MKKTIHHLVACLALVILVPAAAFAESTMSTNSNNHWAWGASAGWINCRPDSTNGASIGEFACSGFFYAPSTGWIHLGNGSPTNGYWYTNVNTNDYGVNHDGKGNLRGYAWSHEVGWIAFEDTGAPSVHLDSGIMTGYAWSEAMGWISFSNLAYFAQSDYMDQGTNSDGDSIPDMWEISRSGSITNLSLTGDYDGDGFLDVDEYGAGTDPTNASSYLEITEMLVSDQTNVTVVWASQPTRLYRLKTTDGLSPTSSWSDSAAGLVVPDGGALSTQTLVGAAVTQGFYRVHVYLPMSQ